MFEIDLQSRLRSQQLYLGERALPSPPQKNLRSDSETESPVETVQQELSSTKFRARKPLRAKQSTIDANSKEPNDLRRFVTALIAMEPPFLTQGELFKRLGISSGSTQAKIKRRLLAERMIVEHKIQVGKQVVSVWEPTDRAYNLAGFDKPSYHSKGGYPHQFCAFNVAIWAKENGYDAEIESLQKEKAVDVVLRKDGEVVFVEIAMSDPMEKEISNIIKDLAIDPQPDRLVMAVKDRAMKEKLQQLIANDERLAEHLDRLKVILVGDFISKLKGEA